MTEQGRYVAAICAAPRVLAKAGLLKDREATAYPGILDSQTDLRLSSAAVVRDGTFITSRGPWHRARFCPDSDRTAVRAETTR
jgi:4-methyl-5(b-hydroxyethyl)-thiazole monophosphate biosynthesis